MLINEYRQKEKLLRQLQDELTALAEREDLKKELAFKEAIEEVMSKYDKTEADVLELFSKSETEGPVQKARRKRTPTKYKNPETGEVIERLQKTKNTALGLQNALCSPAVLAKISIL